MLKVENANIKYLIVLLNNLLKAETKTLFKDKKTCYIGVAFCLVIMSLSLSLGRRLTR